MINKIHFKIYHIIIIVFILLQLSCNRDQISNPVELKSYTEGHTEYHSTQNVKTIVVSNSISGVIITGWSLDDSMRVYMYKTIEAKSSELAEVHFGDIKFTSNIIGDTMIVKIDAPENTDELKYKHSSLSIEVPYDLNCVIGNVNGAIFVDQLSSTVTVTNSVNEVEIERQEGSCEVTSSNNINVQMMVPTGGYSKLSTTAGNVSLGIPNSTNGTVNLRTDEGTITHTNLTFSQLNQTNSTLTGVLGIGNAEITIYTKKGDVTISGLE
jgi:hypothetical protein